ncbi:response regulator [Ramlibacter humi]|uniref:response regulator n=1 Tax=Ramlibacter humi TaxID=2530451 RepID=UPI00142F8850|nr:response regulator [Ramlibacter humi]
MPASPPLVLIADGHADCGETLALALELSGWQVCAARRGEEALVWLRQATPRAVLVDARLPEAGGLHIARVLRANPRFDATQVLLTGTWFTPHEKTQAQACGVDGIWMKPFDISALLRRLEQPRVLRTLRQQGN